MWSASDVDLAQEKFGTDTRGYIEKVNVPCIIDADGLNLLSRKMDLLEAMHSPVILTPHMKEMSRLTGYPSATLRQRWRSSGIYREISGSMCLKRQQDVCKGKGKTSVF